MKKKQMMKINNKSKIPDASGIFATVSQKFKKKKALDLEIGLRLIFMEIWYI